MLMHGQMVQMVPCIISIAGLRMDTVHLIVKLSQKMLGRHVTSKVFRPVFSPCARTRNSLRMDSNSRANPSRHPTTSRRRGEPRQTRGGSHGDEIARHGIRENGR